MTSRGSAACRSIGPWHVPLHRSMARAAPSVWYVLLHRYGTCRPIGPWHVLFHQSGTCRPIGPWHVLFHQSGTCRSIGPWHVLLSGSVELCGSHSRPILYIYRSREVLIEPDTDRRPFQAIHQNSCRRHRPPYVTVMADGPPAKQVIHRCTAPPARTHITHHRNTCQPSGG